MRFRDYYRSANDKVIPSEKLLRKTRKKIENQMIKPRVNLKIITTIATAACMIIATVIAVPGLMSHLELKVNKNENINQEEEENKEILEKEQDAIVIYNEELNSSSPSSSTESIEQRKELEPTKCEEGNARCTQEEIVAYFGRDPMPNYLPEGFEEVSEQRKRTENIVEYTFKQTEKKGRKSESKIQIAVAKGKIPKEEKQYEKAEKYNIKDTSIAISHIYTNQVSGTNILIVQFITQNIGYYIETQNIQPTELIKIIMSIL